MKKINKSLLKDYKLILALIFGFICGCMITVNLVPINKTCKLDDTDREYNIMKNSRLKSPDLIILIISAPQNVDKRNTIRDTWLKLKDFSQSTKDKNFTHRHYFVIGSLGLSVDTVLQLSNEQSLHNDMLILPMHDSYGNLTRKVLKSFAWLREQMDVGLDFKFVLKCDDDSFVRLDSFVHEIQQIDVMYLKSDLKASNLNNDRRSPVIRVNVQSNSNDNEELELYWGYFNGKGRIKKSGKWKEDNWILCDYYLPYALGGGYVLSKQIILFLAQNEKYLRHYHSEDISIGVWLSGVNNIIRIHDVRFDTEWTSRGCQNHHLISHNISTKEMNSMYQSILKTNNLCDSEIVKRMYYLYSWKASPSKCCNKR